MARTLALALALALAGLAPRAAAAPAAIDRLLPAHADRIVVKYRTLDACAHCLVARGVPFASVTGTDSLDRLNRRLGVRGARALFLEVHTLDGGRAAAWRDRMARVRARFPARAARAAGATPDLSGVYVLELPRGADVARAAAAYAADPEVEYAHPDYEVRADLVPDDPYFSTTGSWSQSYPDLWGLHVTQAATAWDTATGAGTVVAVVDTGVDFTHPDLAANAWFNAGEIAGNGVDDDGNGFVDDLVGWDFQQDDATPNDQHGHGTHVAGTVAAVGQNGIGVVGLAFGARVMAVKGLDANGNGYISDLAPGVVYAAENGADVLNNSWGGYGIAQVLVDAVATATSLGAVVVAAAGNEASLADAREPAGIAQVIAVGATRYDDTIASFSNHGSVLSVAAPGVDVLSLRGATSGPVGGAVVGSDYLRLSGTSMASPHAAGLAAVLLSALPGLTPDEVRWHLELNADQPGHPGWEGLPWNPFFGFGRVNAARVFDPPPVTTRLRAPVVDLHTLAGQVTPDAVSLDVAFSSLDPVAWTVTGPSWLVPDPAAGAGPATVSLGLDATGLATGTHTAPVALSAPAAVDGGASVPATVHVHRDERIGDEIVVATDQANLIAPDVASDGLGAVLVWSTYPYALWAARIDGAGAVSGPYLLAEGFPAKEEPTIACDGRGFLVVWSEDDVHTIHGKSSGTESVLALRIGPDGAPLDAVPTVVTSRRYRRDTGIWNVDVAFDGESYAVTWGDTNVKSDVTKAYFVRIGADGSVRSRKEKFYPAKGTALRQYVEPRIACVPGSCLIAWHEADGQTNAEGKYVDKIYGLRIAGDDVLDGGHAFRITQDLEQMIDLTSDGTGGYLALADRFNICPGFTYCGTDAIAARVTAGGTALDPDGIRLNDPPPGGTPSLRPHGIAFDGTNWLAVFREPTGTEGQVFGARVAPDGTVLDDEPEGLLLEPTPSTQWATIAATRTHAVLTWADYRDPFPSVRAQRLLAHPPAPALVEHAIGAIGPQAAAERQALAFTVAAPGLGAGAAFAAGNLPPGAVFDAATRTFRWMPAPDQAGVWPDVHFEATDGGAPVAEDVTIAVAEANLSAGGAARLADGTPVPGVTLRVSGTAGGPRTVLTDAAGRYRFDDLVPRIYSIRLDRTSKRAWRSTPSTLHPSTAAGDVKTADLVLTPKF